MSVIVDTTIWSLAFRRKKPVESPVVDELSRLIHARAAILLGNVRQEILSGLADDTAFERVRTGLRVFPNFALEIDDFERAAEFDNICRRHGVQGSPTDLLMCAVAERRDLSIFTTDKDFLHYSQHVPVSLHMQDLMRS